MKIEIYDQVYNLNSEQDEGYLRELAAYVDGKMRSIAESTHMVDSLKVAVLAALKRAADTCPGTFIESLGAQAELRRLGR